MESLAEGEGFLMDNLLDFSSDIGEVDDEDDDKALVTKTHPSNVVSAFNSVPNPVDSVGRLVSASSPVLLEEELEWLSNRDAFPSIETSDILLEKPFYNYFNGPKHQSPVSVLESSIGSSNLQFPVRPRSKRRRRRRTSFSDISGQPWWWWCEPKKKTVALIGRKCEHCLTEKTPQWRLGPGGPKTLCNACGVRYKSGRLVPEYRPASSPTFSNVLHSNSHRKILDMRKQKQKEVLPQPLDKG
ncbi:hypothetical protein GIB67_028581 [Kingdonia uniflora]|uniref:GATA-type domain-containing protein n=1 Tax=Kingdonia uniflora TaxID=39325 RepID=A0A7J7KZC4_9MAGN|nr:hypothetical protein GIB67_028581 [Kingdonia uniflora]